MKRYSIEVIEERINLGGPKPTKKTYPYVEDGEIWTGSLEEAQRKAAELNKWGNTDTKFGYPADRMRSFKPKRVEEDEN